MIGDVVIIVHTHVNILGTKHTNERHRLEYIFPYLFCFTIRCDAREYYIYIYIYRQSVMACHLEKQRSMISAHALRGK